MLTANESIESILKSQQNNSGGSKAMQQMQVKTMLYFMSW